jgi:hypothetical protein
MKPNRTEKTALITGITGQDGTAGDPRKLETLGWRRRHEIGSALREVLEELAA